MTTAISTRNEYEIKAVNEFRTNFHNLMNCVKDYASARKAAEANNRTHSYTAQYGEAGYVNYPDRNADWKAVDSLINDLYDRNGDIYSESESAMTTVLGLLTYKQQREVMDLVVGFLAASGSVQPRT